MPDDRELDDTIRRMIAAKEPEENIAAVIRGWNPEDSTPVPTVKAEEPKSAYRQFEDFARTPLSGGAFGRKYKEQVDKAPSIESTVGRESGQGTWKDKLINFESQIEGFKRGATEGVGNALDSLTTPADLVSMIGGPIARGLGLGGRAVNFINRASALPNVTGGTRQALDSKETGANRALGVFEAASGAASMGPIGHTPKLRTSVSDTLTKTGKFLENERPPASAGYALTPWMLGTRTARKVVSAGGRQMQRTGEKMRMKASGVETANEVAKRTGTIPSAHRGPTPEVNPYKAINDRNRMRQGEADLAGDPEDFDIFRPYEPPPVRPEGLPPERSPIPTPDPIPIGEGGLSSRYRHRPYEPGQEARAIEENSGVRPRTAPPTAIEPPFNPGNRTPPDLTQPVAPPKVDSPFGQVDPTTGEIIPPLRTKGPWRQSEPDVRPDDFEFGPDEPGVDVDPSGPDVINDAGRQFAEEVQRYPGDEAFDLGEMNPGFRSTQSMPDWGSPEILNPPDLTSPVERLNNEQLTRLSKLSPAEGGTGERGNAAQIELMRRGVGEGAPHVNDPTFYNARNGEITNHNFRQGTSNITRLEPGPVNPLRPEVPPGQVTNRQMFQNSAMRGAENPSPGRQFADSIGHEFDPDMMFTPDEFGQADIPPMRSPVENQFDPRTSNLAPEPDIPPMRTIAPEEWGDWGPDADIPTLVPDANGSHVAAPRESQFSTRANEEAGSFNVDKDPGTVNDTFEEPQFARVGKGRAKIGVDVKHAAGELTTGYSQPLPAVMVREGLQNAMDAVNDLGPNGDVTIRLTDKEGSPRSIEIQDNGKGMSEKELYTVYTDLHSSGKANDPNATGGKGVGKAVYMLGGDNFEVVTVKNIKGQKIQSSFSGTPDELMAGFDIKSEVVSPDTPTGTRFKTTLKGDQEMMYARSALDNITKYSRGRKNKINAKKYEWEGKEEHIPWTDSSTDNKIISDASISNNSSQMDTFIPKNSELGQRSYIEIEVLNNGMWQFSDNMYLDEAVNGIPDKIIVDIKPKVDEGTPDYPFPVQRESMKDAAKQDMHNVIRDKLVNPFAGQRRHDLQKLWDQMIPSIAPGTHRESVFFDPGDRLTLSEKSHIANSPVVKKFQLVVDSLINDILTASGIPYNQGKVVRTGLTMDPNLYGVHIPNPGAKDTSAIFINIFEHMKKKSPKDAAVDTVVTGLHEAAHVGKDTPSHTAMDSTDLDDPRVGRYLQSYIQHTMEQGGLDMGHGMPFIKRLGDMYAKTGTQVSLRYADEFEQLVTGESGGYNPEVQELLRIYDESRGRPATSEDILSGTGIKQADRGTGKGSIPGNDNPNGAGVPKLVGGKDSSRHPTAERWEGIVKELEARNAPDIEYRELFSTGARNELKRGETWKSRVQSGIKYYDNINKQKTAPAAKTELVDSRVTDPSGKHLGDIVMTEERIKTLQKHPAFKDMTREQVIETLHTAQLETMLEKAKIPQDARTRIKVEPINPKKTPFSQEASTEAAAFEPDPTSRADSGMYKIESQEGVEFPNDTLAGPDKMVQTPSRFKEEPSDYGEFGAESIDFSGTSTAPAFPGSKPKTSAFKTSTKVALDPDKDFGPGGDIKPILQEVRRLNSDNAADSRYRKLLPEIMRNELGPGETWKGKLDNLIETLQAELGPEEGAYRLADNEKINDFTRGYTRDGAELHSKHNIPLLTQKEMNKSKFSKGKLNKESNKPWVSPKFVQQHPGLAKKLKAQYDKNKK